LNDVKRPQIGLKRQMSDKGMPKEKKGVKLPLIPIGGK